MGYLDEVGLEHLWGKAKGRFGMAAEGSGESVTADSASKLKGLTVHGKSVQDGTPTPSAPVEIRSVKSRNLLDPTDRMGATSLTSKGVTCVMHEDGWIDVSGTVTGTATDIIALWGANTTDAIFHAGDYALSVETEGFEFSTYFRLQVYSDSSAAYINSATHVMTLSPTVGVKRISFYIYSSATGKTIDGRFRVQLERGSIAHDYQPYGTISLNVGDPNGTYTSTPIDLQGHALRSLPDGTHDELTVDADGNVSMVQRVGAYTVTGSEAVTNGEQLDSYRRVRFYNALNDSGPSINDAQSGWCSNAPFAGGFTAKSTHIYTHIRDVYAFAEATTNADVLAAYTGAVILYPLAEPQTISLGTVVMPELQDGDTIWVDAEVTPSVDAEWWTSQAEFKTINGESLLGNGNIQISGSGTIDAALSDTSANAVQNKVIKAALEALIAVETLYDSSTITVKRSGRTIMVQAHGVSCTPSTSTAVLANVLADYKPEYNISTTVLTSSGGSTQAARMVVYASDGGVYIVPAGYSSSASWYGTLTYIY